MKVNFKHIKMKTTRCQFVSVLILILTLMSCGNKHKQIDQNDIERIYSDTLHENVKESGKVQSIQDKCSRTSSLESHNSNHIDNMRGFDPASEDDMEDNGMSRYMENNDDEGWN